MKCWTLDRPFRRWFGYLGHLIGRKPLPFLVLPICLALALVYPFITGWREFRKFSQDRSGSIDLFTPSNSRSRRDKEVMARLFPDGGYFSDRTVIAPNLFIVLVSSKDEGTVLRANVVEAYYALRRQIESLTVYMEGRRVDYDTLCTADILKEKCTPDYFLEIWKALVTGVIPTISYPYIRLDKAYSSSLSSDSSLAAVPPRSLQAPLYIGPLFGGVVTQNENLIYARYVRMIFNIPKGNASDNVWQEFGQIFDQFCSHYRSEVIDIAYWSAQKYSQDMGLISKRTMRYIPVLIAALLISSLGSCCMRDSVLSKPCLALGGIISSALGVLTGFATLFLFGQHLIEIAMIVPFLVMSIGIDDMFVMLNVWRQTCPCLTVPERLKQTFAESAMSVTVTALTDMVAFGLGVISPFPAVVQFCLFCCMAVGMMLLYQITFFGALMVYTGRREAAGRHCITFRKVKNVTSCERAAGCSTDELNNQYQPMATIFFREYYTPFIGNPITKAAVISTYLFYWVAAIWLVASDVTQGLQVSNLVPYDTSTHDYLTIYEEYFTRCSQSAELVIAEFVDYSRPQIQQILLDFTRNVEFTDYTFKVDFWLQDFIYYLQHNNFVALLPSEFFEVLHGAFLETPMFQRYKSSINFDGFKRVSSSRMWVQMVNMGLQNKSAAMHLLREHVDWLSGNLSSHVHVFDVSFPLAEQYDAILPNTVQDVAIATAAMLVIAAVFIPNFLCCLCVAFAVVSINIGVIGLMSAWKIHLDIISLITILLSIGFSVDYSSHVSYHFIQAKDNRSFTVNDRLKYALETVGWPILQSSLSTLLGVLTVVAVRAYIAETFVKTVFLVMLAGLYHALVVLPVLLSLFFALREALCGKSQCTEKSDKIRSERTQAQEHKTTNWSLGVAHIGLDQIMWNGHDKKPVAMIANNAKQQLAPEQASVKEANNYTQARKPLSNMQGRPQPDGCEKDLEHTSKTTMDKELSRAKDDRSPAELNACNLIAAIPNPRKVRFTALLNGEIALDSGEGLNLQKQLGIRYVGNVNQ